MTREEILSCLAGSDDSHLFAQASALAGKEVFLRGLVEFSNVCARNCLYCGLRRDNRTLRRYRMSAEEILSCAAQIHAHGIRTIVLQSGDDPGCSTRFLCDLVRTIKERYPEMAVTLSVGERPLSDYERFRKAGVDRYLLKHETVSQSLYRRLHPGQSLSRRLAILRHLKTLGFQTGTGCIVGLPGQTLEDLAEDVLFVQNFQPEMAAAGPFVPHHATPLASYPAGSVCLTLRMVALYRLVVPFCLIPATTATETIEPSCGYAAALQAGANVVMVNFTPVKYRSSYSIYDGKATASFSRVLSAISRAGRSVSFSRGDARIR